MADDPIQRLRTQWHEELPDLDTAAMATVARLNRARALTMQRVQGALAAADSSLADFDVLSTLRRQGPPYEMKPSAIARSVMLSPSGMTNRIDQLEAAGLVARVPDPNSRRTAPVALTERGVAEAERLARELVGVEEAMLSHLTTRERATLDDILTTLAEGLDDG
jgi:DNA-binding MarR family transcriptional regulator